MAPLCKGSCQTEGRLTEGLTLYRIPEHNIQIAINPSGARKPLAPPPFTQGRLLSASHCPYCAAGYRICFSTDMRAANTPRPAGFAVAKQRNRAAARSLTVEGNPANVMSDSLTDYLWGPRKIPDFVGRYVSPRGFCRAPAVRRPPKGGFADRRLSNLWGPRKIAGFVGNNNQKNQSNLV